MNPLVLLLLIMIQKNYITNIEVFDEIEAQVLDMRALTIAIHFSIHLNAEIN